MTPGAMQAGGGLPSAEQMMRWISTIVDQGIRRPGYTADRWIERWGVERFTSRGFQLPYTGRGTVEAQLALAPSPDAPGDVAGKIAVVEHKPISLPWSAARETFSTASSDPADFDGLVQILPFDTG